MMDKFLELAKKAGIKAQSESALSPQEQKFAESIARECAMICEESSIPFDISVWHESTKKEMTAMTALALAGKIKEHFRIK